MSTVLAYTRDQVVRAALRTQGYLEEGVAPSTQKLSDMSEALNVMIKSWAKDGIRVWTIEELVLALVAGQFKYVIGTSGADLTANRPMRVDYCFRRLNFSGASTAWNDVPLTRLAKGEYLALGNKGSQGVPNSFMYDARPSAPTGDFYLYNTPDASTTANNNIHIFSKRQINDLNLAADVVDFPQEWYQALKWGLADETSLENQVAADLADRIERKAMRFKKEAGDWDREEGSIYFQPDVQRG